MKNFQVNSKEDNQKYWISRSCAVAMFLFSRDKFGNLCILANKRGTGTPDFQGYWNCPCGYIDFDETGEDAVCREIMEETGYVITPEVPKFVEVETSPKANKQNITLRYTALVPYKLLSQVKPIGGEDNEVEEVKWIDIRKLNNYKWAFNHNKIIERIILLKQYIQNDRHKHFS